MLSIVIGTIALIDHAARLSNFERIQKARSIANYYSPTRLNKSGPHFVNGLVSPGGAIVTAAASTTLPNPKSKRGRFPVLTTPTPTHRTLLLESFLDS
jgi:hypothetical protein